jgi:hypothetical protein
MNLDRKQRVTALTLLDAFDDYCANEPKNRAWDEDQLKNAPAALCRLRQVKALFAAFDLPLEPEDFINGRFIRNQPERYEPLVERLRPSMRPDFAERASPRTLDVVFETLRSYRLGMSRGRRSAGDFLSYSGVLAHVVEDVIVPINREVERVLEPIDSLLAELIAPDRRSFTIGDLIDRYGYPDEDADELEWQQTWGRLFDGDFDEEDAE